ncbi:MAG TPA: SDR family oxidoreductase [Anaerolineales bacterium]|nr:SDR family oxidoreductase [Anaerolineales bacterium]|tara:strand:+ start:1414 stop:2109 length:696 start_codon:yes stop_codon:yes gene_type:complete
MKVLITGANRGIGLEFVRQFAARGERVFATCRQPAEAIELQDLKAQNPDLVSITALDVTNPSSIVDSYNTISTQTETLDLLINNAGINIDDGSFGALDLDTMQSILTVNSIAPMLVTQQYLDLVKAGSKPKIINVSSGNGSLTNLVMTGYYSYSASKAALNMYSLRLSHDLKDTGVIVIMLHPGWVKTDMGGPNAAIAPEDSIKSMLQFVDTLTLDKSGGYYDYAGRTIPW